MTMDIDAALTVREYRAEDGMDALALRNAVFPPIGPQRWTQSQTSAVAFLDGRLVGVIPFVVRDVEIAPGITIRGAFANSVAVAEEYRDRGIGTRMMQAARAFLPRWAAAMLVYTGHERGGPQYRFYAKTGHHDLAYPRRLQAPSPPGTSSLPADAMGLPIETVRDLDAELLDVYAQCYAHCAGTPRRVPGYWPRALASHIFVEIPYDGFQLVALRADGRLQAYAIVGLKHPEAVILECAARPEPPGSAHDLWRAVGALARQHQAQSIVLYGQNLNTPLYGSAQQAGFIPDPRDDVLVGQVIRPQALCALRWTAAADPPDVTLEVWTPAQSTLLRQGPDGAPVVRLEMKEATLHRLLLARVDLAAAVREERVTVRDGDWTLVERIGEVLRPAPWVYHHLDYI